MYEVLAELLLDQVYAYGFIVIICLCLAEGMLVGKVLPLEIIVPAAAIFYGAWSGIAAVFVCAILATTIGQYAVYRIARKEGRDAILESRWIILSESHLSYADSYFEKWGIRAIAITNSLPVLRGTLSIPAGVSEVPARNFLVASIIGTSVYYLALLAVTLGIVQIVI